MNQDIIEQFAKLYVDMQVVVSLGLVKDTVREDWVNIKNTLNLFGWVDVDQVIESINNYILKDTTE